MYSSLVRTSDKQHSIKTTVVAEEAVIITDENKLMVEYSDGKVKVYSFSYTWRNFRINEVRWKTPDQVGALVCNHNNDCRLNVNNALYEDKVRRLGWDHEQRGY